MARARGAVGRVAVQVDHLAGDRHLVARHLLVRLRRQRGQRAERRTAVVARMRFSIVHPPVGEFRTTCENEGATNCSRLPYVSTGGSRFSRILAPWRGLSRTAGYGLAAAGSARPLMRLLPSSPPMRVFLETLSAPRPSASTRSVPTGRIRRRTRPMWTFKSGEVYVAGPWFATEFRCTYRRRRSGDWVDARGAISAKRRTARSTEMRMYWQEPRSPAGSCTYSSACSISSALRSPPA